MLADDSTSLAHQRTDDRDVDYDYYWSRGDTDVRVPNWLAEILELPRGLAIEIFLFGLFLGIIVVGSAVLIGFLLSVG